MLKLASAAAFRRTGPVFTRFESGDGWDDCATRTLPPDEPMIAPLSKGAPFNLADDDEDDARLPSGLRRPILAVPAASRIRCFAITLYGPHASGTDLDTYERAMLARLGANAADVYAELENDDLRRTIEVLEDELSTAKVELDQLTCSPQAAGLVAVEKWPPYSALLMLRACGNTSYASSRGRTLAIIRGAQLSFDCCNGVGRGGRGYTLRTWSVARGANGRCSRRHRPPRGRSNREAVDRPLRFGRREG